MVKAYTGKKWSIEVRYIKELLVIELRIAWTKHIEDNLPYFQDLITTPLRNSGYKYRVDNYYYQRK